MRLSEAGEFLYFYLFIYHTVLEFWEWNDNGEFFYFFLQNYIERGGIWDVSLHERNIWIPIQK